MKKIIFAVAVTAIFVLTGCVSISTSDGATAVPQPKSCHPGYAAKFTHKDVRVKGSATINVLFNLFAWGAEGFAENTKLSGEPIAMPIPLPTLALLPPSPDTFAKEAAVYATCKANQADTLVGTRYIVTTTDYFVFKIIKCEVAGFPAVMKGVVEKKPYVTSAGKLYWLAEKPIIVK